MSVNIGTNVGPVRVSKRLGRRPGAPTTTDAVVGAVELTGLALRGLPWILIAAGNTLALVITGYWAVFATALALAAGVVTGVMSIIPGTRRHVVKASRVARWSWYSVPALYRRLKVKR